MSTLPRLLGPDGRPVDRKALTVEQAAPTLTGVRPAFGAPPVGDFTPGKVGRALRAADEGDPLAYLELAERVEELDAHYLGVLSTRKRAVSQLPVQIDAASDDAAHVGHADAIRDWLQRDELQGELFDMLDAIGKGYSLTEIVWTTQGGVWRPARLERRPQTWFTLDRADGTTPLLRTERGEEPLQPYGWVFVAIQAKSGLPVRSGLARLALWHWMFKSFAGRDWAIFVQAYGQPIRVGKYHSAATEADRDVLWRAVANIAGDCAAIIPDSMVIEFIESKSVATSGDLYRQRLDWLDQQMSKAVLGQTATTDAIAGGHAVGREHRQVQEDIERADAVALASALNRQLVRPWIDLEFGPQQKYPKLRIGREETVELKTMLDAVKTLVPYGLRVEASTVADRLGLPDPDKGAVLLRAPAQAASDADAAPDAEDAPVAGDAPPAPPAKALHAARPAPPGADAIDAAVAGIIAEHGYAMVADVVDGLGDEIARCGSLAEVEQLLGARLAAVDTSRLTAMLARAAFAARLAGEAGEPLT